MPYDLKTIYYFLIPIYSNYKNDLKLLFNKDLEFSFFFCIFAPFWKKLSDITA